MYLLLAGGCWEWRGACKTLLLLYVISFQLMVKFYILLFLIRHESLDITKGLIAQNGKSFGNALNLHPVVGENLASSSTAGSG